MLTNEEILEGWNRQRERIEQLAAQCMAEPETAALRGIQVVARSSSDAPFVGVRQDPAPKNFLADWLRACAKHHLGTDTPYQWNVVETIGGGAYLVLHGYRTPDERHRS